ncbi:Bifunctional polynucleotide phosphatase/kinase [Habropoda laboriosa]|uniref:Bifunctional polynucleotide phosphatase/kinase n=1 Tax=Habropoda laboriosa TaxID=597456 RepID=A0A0L7QV67_9HYME|nr:Bifunctional polynucleotide phosphatase/kinase [Habropoda laboriosa]
MNQPAKSCYLKSNNKTLMTVYLPNQKTLILGRCPETNITDTQCSRQQVQLHADYEDYKVFIQQIGKRPCGFNGFKTRKDVRFIGKHEDCLEFLYGKHTYQIEFNPSPPKTLLSEKRTRDSEIYLGQKQDMWESEANEALLIYTTQVVKSCSKVAAYDMDGTLIKTKSGLVFPKDYNDWQLTYPDVPMKLKELHNNGYKIVVFTNQASIGSGRINVKLFKRKLKNIIQKIGVPIQIFIATGNSIYRKPAIGMWQKLEEKNAPTPIDKDNSFYVGDAAGRTKNWAPGKKKDHSLADRLLALNLGLKFYTPEEHFRGHKQAPFQLPAFNPKNLPDGEICSGTSITSSDQEVILMVGCPGSGKSHFVKNYLNHYECINRDTLGSWKKCVSMMERYISEKRSVVVDNTNPDPVSRQRYIEIAKKYRVPVRCFVMTTTIDHAKHNNKFRELTDPSHVKISELLINFSVKNYQPPSLHEDFLEIVHLNFVPKFQREKDRELYQMYLLEG